MLRNEAPKALVRLHFSNLDLGRRDADRALLSPQERGEAERFLRPRDARRYVTGRATLRKLLAARLSTPPEEVPLVTGEHGKPAVEDGRLAFSLSHAGPLLMIAITEARAIGCDIESERAAIKPEEIAPLCLRPREMCRLNGYAGRQRMASFLDLWTRKEAYLKAVGRGMSLEMTSFEVAPGDYGQVTSAGGDTGWRACSWQPFPDYHASIVAQGDDWAIDKTDQALPIGIFDDWYAPPHVPL